MDNVIKLIREALGLNKNQLANLLGLNNSYIYQYENGGRALGRKMIQRIKEKIPNINENFLLNGVGDIFIPATNTKNVVSNERVIKVFGSVNAGLPAMAWNNEQFNITLDFPELNKIKNKNLFAFIVKGESMMPRFKDGDIVITALMDNLPHNKEIVVVNFRTDIDTDSGTIKKVFWKDKKEGDLILAPLNSDYPPGTYNLKEILSFFQVYLNISSYINIKL